MALVVLMGADGADGADGAHGAHNAEEVDGVWQTEDYVALKSMLVAGIANRNYDQKHVDRLMEDMKERGFRSTIELGLTTIFSAKRGGRENELKILDGQHRALAAIQYFEITGKSIKVKFSVTPITSKEDWAHDHIQAQKLVRKQSITDYILPQSFAGNGDYQKFETIYQHYKNERKAKRKKGFGRELLMMVMTGAYGGMKSWVDGTFKIKKAREQVYASVMEKVFELQEIFDIRNVPQMRSIAEIVMHPKYDHYTMVRNITKWQKSGKDVNLRDKNTFSADLYQISGLSPIRVGKNFEKKK
jgi:hypothetical protein